MQPFGKAADGKKEEARGEQDNGWTGGNVERVGQEHPAHCAEGPDQHGIERHLSEAMGELIGGGGGYKNHGKNENRAYGFQ